MALLTRFRRGFGCDAANGSALTARSSDILPLQTASSQGQPRAGSRTPQNGDGDVARNRLDLLGVAGGRRATLAGSVKSARHRAQRTLSNIRRDGVGRVG